MASSCGSARFFHILGPFRPCLRLVEVLLLKGLLVVLFPISNDGANQVLRARDCTLAAFRGDLAADIPPRDGSYHWQRRVWPQLARQANMDLCCVRALPFSFWKSFFTLSPEAHVRIYG